MPAPIALDFTDDERLAFWSRVRVRPGVVNCWIWKDAKYGYGSHNYRGVHIPAHRLAYAMAYGVDPGALLVRHSCDDSRCKNPRHLSLGTYLDNAADIIVSKMMARMATVSLRPNTPRTDAYLAFARKRAVVPRRKKGPVDPRRREAALLGAARVRAQRDAERAPLIAQESN